MRTRIANPVARAFTLIEILIVVVILGILAAIVIPQFQESSDAAMESSVRTTLQTVRSQIELFRFRDRATHDASTAATLFSDMVAGGYLQQAPRNPLQDDATATVCTAAPDADAGWFWGGPDQDFGATDGAGGAFVE